MTLLIGPLALKMPRLINCYQGRIYSFAQAVSMNRTEYIYAKKYRAADPCPFCPVWFSLFGIVNVMPRCRDHNFKIDDRWVRVWVDYLKTFPAIPWWLIEAKPDSVKKYNGMTVAVDFGSTTISQQERT